MILEQQSKELYWYTAKVIPKYDIWYATKEHNFYGFEEEPGMEDIEEYDLRFIEKTNWGEVTKRYF